MVKSKKNRLWKPVEITLKDPAPDLIGFEELVNYTAIKGKHDSVQYNEEVILEETKKKRKKKNTTITSNKRRKNVCDTNESLARDTKKKKLVNREYNENAVSLKQEHQSISDVNMSAWIPFSLPEELIKALTVKKFTQPTEIQKLVLPEAIVNKKDILASAETGSGKTLAFAIPIVSSLLENQKNTGVIDSLWALVLTPTRELAIQVKNHFRDICMFTNIKVQEIVGGLSVEKQNRKLGEKPQIVVATPGRLWELIRSGNNHLSNINHIRFLVIDEADRIFEKHHFTELENLLEKISYSADKKMFSFEERQIFVLSATLTMVHEPPLYVHKKKKKVKKNQSVKITPEKKLFSFIDSLNMKNPAIIDITKKHVLASGISESCIQCALDEKDYYLYYLIKVHSGKKIVFCNSVNCVKRLYRLLNVLQCNAKILFADMDQKHRLKNLDNFEKNPNGLLIATDVAARGLDIAEVDYIIHYQVPKTTEIYVHRSGRSVRGMSAHGTSIILCSPAENCNFEKIQNTLEKDKKLPSYNISQPEAFLAAKQVINVSRNIEQMETKIRSIQSNASCIEKWAKEMDILIDEDEMPEKLNEDTRKSCQQQIKKLRAELKYLLAKPILPMTESLRYPRFEAIQSYIKQISLNKN